MTAGAAPPLDTPYLFVAAAGLAIASGRGSLWTLAGGAAGAAAFGLALGREPLVVFLALFLAPTALAGVRAWRGRAGLDTFGLFALSDAALALGLTIQHARTTLWTLPEAGGWGTSAGMLVAGAATLRLAGARPDGSGGAQPLAAPGWWQGMFLAWWAGEAAAPVMVPGAAALVAMGILLARRGHGESGLAVGGGLGALLAALGAGPLLLGVAGLAGVAFAAGERAVSFWTLGVLPLSAPAGAALGVERVGLPFAAGGAVLTPALAAAAHYLPRAGSPGRGGLLPAAAAAGGAIALLAGRPELLVWLAYGTLAAAVGADLLSASSPREPERGPTPAVLPAGRAPALASVAAFAVALVLEARLVLLGVTTGFL